MSFARPDLVWLALGLPLLVAAAVALWLRRRRRVAAMLGEPALLARLGAPDLAHPSVARALLVVGAASALGLAAAGPRWGLEEVEERRRSLDLVLALDVSRSMLAADVEPDRLERERLLARRLLRELPGDRIGMVAFAGRAYVLSPPTLDHSALQLYLDALDPEIVSQGGSSLSSAIRQAADLARGNDGVGHHTVIVVSDGEALEEEAAVMEAADRAAGMGVVIHTVGVGTVEGAPIPQRDPETGSVLGYQRDLGGEVVMSKLQPSLLRDVARRTGGRYVQLSDPGALSQLLSGLRGMERTVSASGRRVQPRERYAWFVALALLLLATDALLDVRGRGWRSEVVRVREREVT